MSLRVIGDQGNGQQVRQAGNNAEGDVEFELACPGFLDYLQ